MLLFLLRVNVWTFITVYFFNEGLINWGFILWLFGCANKVSLNSFNVLIWRLFLTGFLNVSGIYVFFIIVRFLVTVWFERNVMIFWYMGHRVSFCIKHSLSCLNIGLWMIFLILIEEAFMIACIFVRDIDLCVWLGLEMFLTVVDSWPIEWILVCPCVHSYLWPAIVTLWSEQSSIRIQILNCLLPLVVRLRIVVLSDEYDSIVKDRGRLRV